MWYNPKHLKEAKIKAGKPNAGYWWHFHLAIKEFFFLFLLHDLLQEVLSFHFLTQ